MKYVLNFKNDLDILLNYSLKQNFLGFTFHLGNANMKTILKLTVTFQTTYGTLAISSRLPAMKMLHNKCLMCLRIVRNKSQHTKDQKL